MLIKSAVTEASASYLVADWNSEANSALWFISQLSEAHLLGASFLISSDFFLKDSITFAVWSLASRLGFSF